MKTLLSIGTLLLALPILQILPPPPPAPPPPPQRGQTTVPAPATPQPAPLTAAECKCSIDITVKRQNNGEPISDVSVTVSFTPTTPTPAGASATPAARVVLTEMTDITGHALFPNLAEGTYQVMAQREGYFGPLNNGNAPTQVNTFTAIGPAPNNAEAGLISYLEAGALARSGISSVASIRKQPVQHVAIQMIQGGVISGRIRDANHRPASGIQVAPFQISFQNGQRVLRQTATAVQTDDLGEFRLFWFAPGEYYIRTAPQPTLAARGGGPNYPSPTFYPGTMDLTQARPIVVREGQEDGSDVELQKAGGVTISGTVINMLPGRVNPNGQMNRSISQFFLVPRNSNIFEPVQTIPNVASNGARGAAATANDTTEFPFEIRGVPPGSYDFYPIFNDGASPRANTYTGHVAIEVAAENITGIKTAIQPGVDLKVHVSVTGTAPSTPANRPAPQFSLQTMRVQVRPFDNLPNPLANTASGLFTPGDDGFITFSNLPEARFFIPNIPGIPADAYISEIRQGSRSIMDDTVITIGKGTPDPLEIVIGRGGGTISGTVQDAQHKPLTNARVFLIPDQPRRGNLLLYKTASSSTMGAFTFQGIAPGAYKIFAWDNIPQGAEQNDEYVRKYDGLGTRVIVNTGTPETSIQVTLIQGNR